MGCDTLLQDAMVAMKRINLRLVVISWYALFATGPLFSLLFFSIMASFAAKYDVPDVELYTRIINALWIPFIIFSLIHFLLALGFLSRMKVAIYGAWLLLIFLMGALFLSGSTASAMLIFYLSGTFVLLALFSVDYYRSTYSHQK